MKVAEKIQVLATGRVEEQRPETEVGRHLAHPRTLLEGLGHWEE